MSKSVIFDRHHEAIPTGPGNSLYVHKRDVFENIRVTSNLINFKSEHPKPKRRKPHVRVEGSQSERFNLKAFVAEQEDEFVSSQDAGVENLPSVSQLFSTNTSKESSLIDYTMKDLADFSIGSLCKESAFCRMVMELDPIEQRPGFPLRAPRPIHKSRGKVSKEESVDDDDAHHKPSPRKKRLRVNHKAAKAKVTSGSSESGEEEDDEGGGDGDIEQYFLAHGTSQPPTSSHTLSSLPLDQLTPDVMRQAVRESQEVMAEARDRLVRGHEKSFRKWMLHFSQGRNILLYGLGSKRTVVQKFAEQMLSDKYNYINVDAFIQNVTIREIVLSVCDALDIAPLHFHRGSVDIETHIERERRGGGYPPLFLLVNNIDSEQLRNERSQMLLRQLASLSFIHVLATVDHVNAALIWTQVDLCKFRWFYCDATTFLPYEEEVRYEDRACARLQTRDSVGLSSLRHVFRSLPGNTKKIFMLILEYHMDHKGNQDYTGMPLSECYRMCRSEFLVNTESTLRSQFTEFKDHKLIRLMKCADSSETIKMLVDDAVLLEFKEEIASV